jgi:hypothetical protein
MQSAMAVAAAIICLRIFSKLLMFHLICTTVWMRFRQWTAETQAHEIAPSRRMGKTFVHSSTSIKASSTD